MARTGKGLRGGLKPPPLPGVGPDALVGRIVQIALGGSDRDNILGLVPPLKVSGWAVEKLHYATLEDPTLGICFIGIPIPGFTNPVQVDPRLLQATGIRFGSRMPLFQPHYLMDTEFLRYFETDSEDVVPVEVFATESHHNMDREFISDEYNFSYIGEGVLQLFEPKKGFQKPWPRRFPWHRELAIVEEWLLSHCGTTPTSGR